MRAQAEQDKDGPRLLHAIEMMERREQLKEVPPACELLENGIKRVGA